MSELDETRVRQTNAPLCCLWKERLPHRLQRVWDLVCRLLHTGGGSKKTAKETEVAVRRTRTRWYLSTIKKPANS